MVNKMDMLIILNRLASVFGKELETNFVDTYSLALKQYPRMALADAAMLCVQENNFMPRPSEIVAKIEKYDLERKWQAVEPSTERMFWVLFRENYDSTDDLTEADCYEIFGKEYVGAPKVKKVSQTKNMSDEERRNEFRKLYQESKNVPQN